MRKCPDPFPILVQFVCLAMSGTMMHWQPYHWLIVTKGLLPLVNAHQHWLSKLLCFCSKSAGLDLHCAGLQSCPRKFAKHFGMHGCSSSSTGFLICPGYYVLSKGLYIGVALLSFYPIPVNSKKSKQNPSWKNSIKAQGIYKPLVLSPLS